MIINSICYNLDVEKKNTVCPISFKLTFSQQIMELKPYRERNVAKVFCYIILASFNCLYH